MELVKAIVILSSEGKRSIAQYYDDKLNPAQFDKQLFSKTKSQRVKEEVLLVDNYLVLHKWISDLHVYVVGHRNANPSHLDKVLCCIVEVISTLMARNLEHSSLMDHLSQVILAFDEIYDRGTVLEIDPDQVLQIVCQKDGVAEQTMASVIQNATEQFKVRWMRS